MAYTLDKVKDTVAFIIGINRGSHPKPGEISLAHNGVLFLDELPEFDRKVLEVLREPIESGQITISRAARQVCFPARFQLIAAMNPCPCGFLGDHSGRCRCTAEQVARYRGKLSGPLLDRIDLHLDVHRPPPTTTPGAPPPPEDSATVRARVEASYQRQIHRAGKANAHLSNTEIERDCVLGESDQQLLRMAMERMHLSLRAYHRILKVARTIADLAGAEQIATTHLTEALGYRDKKPS